MTRRYGRPQHQAGAALLAILAMLVLAAGYAFYRHANQQNTVPERDAKLMAIMARAKEALIARAATDSNRPGSLPCPDLITNDAALGNNVPGDGKADMFTMTQCPSYVGWLPWVTLDLPELLDDSGTRLWYVLAREMRDDDSAQPINSNTSTGLKLDGKANGDVVALIIAPRGALAAQSRASQSPADYLDGENGNGDDNVYVTGPQEALFNDQVMVVTRQEVMAAVEQRIANELRTCLEQHASNASNVDHSYPWPAPLGSTQHKGMIGSLFGLFPDTQPGNPEQALKDTVAKLTQTRTALSTASNASDQIAAATQLQAQAAYARAIFDRLYLLAVALGERASQTSSAFDTLDDAIVAATASNSIYATQAAKLPAAINTALPTLAAFRGALLDSGLDLFLPELQVRNATLKTRLDTANSSPTTAQFNALITPVNQLKNNLLEYSWSPNTEVETPLSAAYSAAINAATAVNLARKYTQQPYINQALASTTTLYDANRALESTLTSRRTNIAADEFAYRAARLSAAANEFGSTGDEQTLQLLLQSAQNLLSSLSGGATTVQSAKASAASAVSTARGLLGGNTDRSAILSSVTAAATQLNSLAIAIAGNGDNIAIDTLKSVGDALTAASQNIPANVTDGRALRQPVKTVLYLSAIATSQVADLSRLARKGLSAQEDSDSSAYTAASRLLDSLDGSTGALAYLNAYSKNPSEENRQAAQTALNATLALLDTLLTAANTLDGALATGLASAGIPTIWYGSACAMLQPATGSASWWTANNWKTLFFYQVSDRIRLANGTLTVNGSGAYRAVVVGAGKALPGQDRNIREVAHYLEKSNADASRNGLAQSPSRRFITDTVSTNFNDRIAY